MRRLFTLLVSLFFVSGIAAAQSITPTAGALPAFTTTTYGTISNEQNFSFTAAGLIGSEVITITAPTGFGLSKTAGGLPAGTYSGSVTVTANGGGNVTPAVTIYVVVLPTASAGSHSGNITLTTPGGGSGVTANKATTASTVNAKALTLSGLTVPPSRSYNGLTSASASGSPALLASETMGTGSSGDGKPYTGDDVTLNVGALSGTYNSKDVAAANTVTVSGLSLTGTSASNYSLTNTVAATITKASLTITGLTANSKAADGNNVASLSGSAVLNGVQNSEDITLTGSASATFPQTTPGTNLTVTVTGYTLGGTADANNYTLSQPSGLTADIYSNTAIAKVDVTTTSPINTSSPTVAVLGFSLNNATFTGNFTSLNLATTADPSTLFSSIKLLKSTDNVYGGDTQVTATLNQTTNSISFSSISGQSITSGVTFYYFLEVTLKPTFASVDPTIKISFDPTTDIGLSGGVTGTGSVINTINGANSAYTLHDDIAPTVAITKAGGQSDPTNASPITYTITFSEPIDASTFATGDITVGGTATGTSVNTLVNSGDNTTWTLTVNVTGTQTGTVIPSIAASAVNDPSLNNSAASTNTTVTFDNQAPTVTLNQGGSQTDPTNTSPITFTIVFSEPINASTFTNGDITFTGSATGLSVNSLTTSDNTTWTLSVAVSGTQTGTVIPAIAAAAVKDLAGNDNTANTFTDNSVTFDNVLPTVAITVSTALPTSATSLDFTVTFSKSVTGVALSDFALSTAAPNSATGSISNISGSGTTYTVTVSSIVGQYAGGTQAALNLDIADGVPLIKDALGNTFGGTFTTDDQYLVDNTAPTLSPDQMYLQLNGGAAETITFTFSEDMNIPNNTDIKANLSLTNGGNNIVASAIYNSSTRAVTMTSSGDAQWTSSTTVTYNQAPGNYADLTGNLLAAIPSHAVIQQVVNLSAGDVMFTAVNSDNDKFAVVILRSIPAGTQIVFTDAGWKSSVANIVDISNSDGLFTWTVPTGGLTAGTEVIFTANGSSDFSSSLGVGSVANGATNDKVQLDPAGDEIIAYQTNGVTKTILGAVKFGEATGWLAWGVDPSDSKGSNLPGATNAVGAGGLLSSQYILFGDNDDGAYKRTTATTDASNTGSTTELRTLLTTGTNWSFNNTETSVTLPGGGLWSAYPTLTNTNNLNYVIRHKINSVSIPDAAMKVGSVVIATILVDDDAGLTPSTIVSGTIDGFTLGSLSRTNSTTFTAQFTVDEVPNGSANIAANGSIPVANLVLRNSLSNDNPAYATSLSTGVNDAIDATSPYITSINRNTTTNVWSTTNATSATSVVFTVAFSETMKYSTLGTNDFTIPVSGLGGTPTISNISPTTDAASYDITVTGYTGTGTIGLNYLDSDALPTGGPGGSITDLAGNTTKSSTPLTNADGSVTGQTFTIVKPEPNGNFTSTTSSNVTSNSATITWAYTSGTQNPTNYLVLAKPTTGGTYPPLEDTPDAANSHHPVADGNPVTGTFAKNVAFGTNTWTFTGLSSGTNYDFVVYPYVNTNDNIDYQTTATSNTASGLTSTASVSWVVQNGSYLPISSVTDDNPSGDRATVLSFKIYDDGQNPLSPNAMILHLNGTSSETITFNLTEKLIDPSTGLDLSNGTPLSGFTTSGACCLVSAVYSGAGTTNTVTLTSSASGIWTSATTVTYSPVTGNLKFVNLGNMQPINAHSVVPDVTTYSTPGASSFTVPPGVTEIQVETWGAGGAGGAWNSGYGGGSGGGGGGAYARSVLTVTPGATYNLTVGAGGASMPPTGSCCGNSGGTTSFSGPSLVSAEGGHGALASTYFALFGNTYTHPFYGRGGTTTNSNAANFPGGDGGLGGSNFVGDGGTTSNPAVLPIPGNVGGSGGSSAGSAQAGSPGSNGLTYPCCWLPGGTAPLGGGSGGAGISTPQPSANVNGVFPGGGGGGVGSSNPSGAGANGQVIVTLTNPAQVTGASDWDADNAPFKFNKIVFTQGTGISPAPISNNLNNLLAGAELTDDAGHTFNSIANSGNVIIGTNTITFQNLPATSSTTDIGYVPDANGTLSSRTYTLKVWLKNNLDNALASSIDGLNLAFAFDPATASNLGYDNVTNNAQKSSQLLSPVPAIQSGTEQIQVVASQLVYQTPGSTIPAGYTSSNTNPQAQIGVSTPFFKSSTHVPEVYALDANNNLDLNYTSANGNGGTITNTTAFGQSFSGTFTSGKLSLSSFYFTEGSIAPTSVTTQIVVTGTGSPSVTPATSIPVWPVISNLTTILPGTLPASELASFPSTTTSSPPAPPTASNFNFDFVVTDDAGADATTFNNNDGLPTIIPTITISQDPNNGINGGGADATTFDKWTKSIQGAELRDELNNIVSVTTINDNSLVFNLPASMQTVPDGASKTYQLRIWLKSPVDPTLADILDNKDFVFSIDQSGLGIAPTANTSSAYATSSTNTGDGRNVVTVTATQIDFVTQWAAPAGSPLVYVNQSYDATLSVIPQAKARDVNGNLDLDWNVASPTLSAAPNPGKTYPPDTNPTGGTLVTLTNGVFTFDNTLRVTSTGNGTNGDVTHLILNSGAISGNSYDFKLGYSANSDIVRASFSHPTNIDYASAANQTTDINGSSGGTTIEKFTVRDGGAAANDADGTGTTLDGVVFNIQNSTYLRRIALYNAGGLFVAETNVTGSTVTFAGLAAATNKIIAPKNSTADFTVKVSFQSTVVDNAVVNLNVASVTAGGSSSAFINGASTTMPSLATNENKIAVTATRLDITTPSGATSASLNSDFPGNSTAIVVQARDGLANLDVDFTGKITSVTNAINGTMTGTSGIAIGTAGSGIQFGTTAFSGGLLSFPTAFQFTSGTNGQVVTLTVKADNAGGSSGTTCGTNAICASPTGPPSDGISPVITLITSFESSIQGDPTFVATPATKIPYVTHQESTLTSSSFELARVLVVDGSRLSSNKYAGSLRTGGTNGFSGTDSGDSDNNHDLDQSLTALTSLTISVSNPSNLRTIGLFDGSGNPVGSQIDVKALNLTSPSTPHNFAFTGSPLVTAPDDSSAVLSIRVSFNNTPTTVKDMDDISIQLIAAGVGAGSQFYNGNPANSGMIGGVPITFLGGHDASLLTSTSYGRIDVVATSLDFTTQPSAYAGVNEPVGIDPATSLPYVSAPLQSTGAGVVKARDKFALIDTEFSPVSGSLTGATTGSVTIPASVSFVNGVVNLDGIQYTASGDGTLTATIKRASSGTITTSTASASVTGVGTTFLSDLTPGMILYDNSTAFNVIGTVQTISSNTSMTLTGNAGVTLTASAYLAELNSSKANQNTTGAITAGTGSTSVTGSGTLFTTELAVGSIINDTNGTPVGTVASIGSNTSLTLSSNAAIALSSASYNTNAIFSSHVDVLDVTVTYDGSHGVVPPTTTSPPGASLKGGVGGYNIFGLKFTATNTTVGSEPYIKGFTINFDVPFESAGAPTFKNFIVKMVNSSGTFDIASWSKAGPSPGVYDKIIVDLSGSPQSLGLEPGPTKSISFFLYADVDAKVNLSTAAITPYFSDKGYASPVNADNTNSLVSEGTSHGAFSGNKYSFASTQPPVLLTSNKDLTSPYAGQPNVDPFLSQVVLQFNTNVGSLDAGGPGNAELWSRDTNMKVADLLFNTTTPESVTPALPPRALATVNGNNTVNNIYQTLLYDVTDPNNYGAALPAPLNPDGVYYVKLIKGNYDAVTGKGSGITDFGLNFYGGISSNSVLYFKISSAIAPKLSNATSTFNTTTIGTLTTNFDQFGTAFYLIVKSGATAPSATQVMDPTAQATYITAIGGTAMLGASGSYPITAINADQTATFTATYAAGQAYDVYIIAQNDAVAHGVSSPVVAAGVYGSSTSSPKYGAGTLGPTTKIPGTGVGSVPTSVTTSVPNIGNGNFLICPDSYYTITSPIIIAEKQNAPVVSFAMTDPATTDIQDFNILLPTGYQFDVNVKPNVQLFGADFSTLSVTTTDKWKYSYTSNTVLNISFKNTTTTNPSDFIVVSGLSIIGKTGSQQGDIQWFYGNNIFTNSPTLPSTFKLGTIALQSITPVDFVNSYWQSNRALFNALEPPSTLTTTNIIGDALDKTVNAIPDNYVDATFPGQVQLIPDSRTFGNGDYLASTFSGSGVSGDLFTLNSVATGSPFNITVTHTDLNGCVTQKTEQYLVYDHRNTISNKLGLAYPTPSTLAGTEQALLNPNWPSAAASITSPILFSNELAGYTLMKLAADLPSNEVALNQAIPATATQLMAGPTWRTLVQNNVLAVNTPSNAGPPVVLLSYKWDYSAILNADAATVKSSVDPTQIFNTAPNFNPAATDVYDYFKSSSLSSQKNNYWLGGSLGKVEFTGIYQSTADNSVYNPFRQSIELFVPAVPVLEVNPKPAVFDAADPAMGANGVSVQSLGSTAKVYSNLYPGTAIFCEHGGAINISGYPTATAGVSGGVFGIYDYATYDFTKVIVPSGTISTQKNGTAVFGTNTKFLSELVVGATLFDPQGVAIGQVATIFNDTQLAVASPGVPTSYNLTAFRANLNTPLLNNSNGFVDNQNGSMSLDPLKINNTYKDVLVTYTYQENTSPAYGIGYLVIRVTPNPVPAFTIQSAVSNPGSSTFGASCKDNPVQFDANSSTIGGLPSNTSNANYIKNYSWSFGDPGSGSPNQPSLVAGTPGGPSATQIPAAYVQTNAPAVQYFDKPIHVFGLSNTYIVNLSLTSNWGCPSLPTSLVTSPTVQTSNLLYGGSSGSIDVGENPDPLFTITNNCVGELIGFDASTSSIKTGGVTGQTITKYKWLYDSLGSLSNHNTVRPYPATGLGSTVSAQYKKADFYNVQLTTITNLGCQASLLHLVSQLDVAVKLNEYFDRDNGKWQAINLSNSLPDSISRKNGTSFFPPTWKWGTRGQSVNTSVLDGTGNNFWSTYVDSSYVNYRNQERSALYSPCLDIASVPRPMISFSSFVDVATGDGLVLQYSIDNKNIMDPTKVWANLGTTDNTTQQTPYPGVDWFTNEGLPSNPGTSNNTGTGWSGRGKKWIHPKHELDKVQQAIALMNPKPKAVLRFALASVAQSPSAVQNFDGAAIDSVYFGSRTRTILFEDFVTTDGGANTALNNSLLYDNNFVKSFVQKNINQTQLVNINYHVGFNGLDPFNLDNTADPGARALFYNVKKVPYAFLDGTHYQDPTRVKISPDTADLFKYWGQAQYDLQTLKLAQADFNNTITPNADGSFTIDVKFTPLFDMPIGVGGTTLQIAILEKSISGSGVPSYGKVTTGETSFDYVFKKMLPSAIGTQFTTPLRGPTPGPTPTSPPVYYPVSAGTFKYTPKNLHSTMLTIVVFLQNETTKEVYQADLNDDIPVNTVITGVEPLSQDNIKLYPNPADQELTVELPSPVTEPTTLRLANQWGQFTEMTSFSEGEQKKTISTRDLAEGVYILQLGGNTNAVRAKVVVVHK